MRSRARTLRTIAARVLGATVIAVGLLGGGVEVLTSRPQVAHAAEPPRLEVAPLGTTTWGDTITATWALLNARPGSTTAAGLTLRVASGSPGNHSDHADYALVLRATTSGSAHLAGHLLVTAMTLDGADLLPEWTGCTAGTLTLASLATCAEPPLLPLPSTAGSDFAMELTVDPTLGNDGQGATIPAFSLAFSAELHPGASTFADSSSVPPPPPDLERGPDASSPPTDPPAPPPVDRPAALPPNPRPDRDSAEPSPGTPSGAPRPARSGHGAIEEAPGGRVEWFGLAAAVAIALGVRALRWRPRR